MALSAYEQVSPSRRAFPWRTFWILSALIALGLLALLPYSLTLAGITFSATLIPQLSAQFFIQWGLYALLAAIGIRMWKRTGLGAPLLEGRLATSAWKPLWNGLAIGLTCGLAAVALDVFFFAPRLAVETAVPGVVAPTTFKPALWRGFLAAFYGGIVEEILLRLFLLTLLAWLGHRPFHRSEKRPNQAILWVAILISGLVLGLGHLPSAATLGIPLTPLYIARTLVLNAVGIVFGWLYWRRGLESAMAAHFASDIALHVVGVLLLA